MHKIKFDSLTVNDFLEYSEQVEKHGIKYFCGGQFTATLLGSDCIEKDFALALEKCNYSVEDLMLNSVGRFFVKVISRADIKIYSSVSDYGVYYHLTENNIDIRRKVDHFKLPINDKTVVSAVNSHHLVGRSHFGAELFLGAQRIMPGCCWIVNGEKTLQVSYLVKKHLNEGEIVKSRNLNKMIRRVLEAYELTDKDCLLFSGGIDSSVLASVMKRFQMSGDFVNFRYDDKSTDDSKIVSSFKANYLHNLKYEAVGLMPLEEVRLLMERDYGTVQGPQYFKNRRFNSQRLITGQNLDTLMHIDTFAPGSAYQGLIGVMMNALSFRKRFLISSYLFNSPFIKKHAFHINLNGKEFDIINHLYALGDEHTSLSKNLVKEIEFNEQKNYISEFVRNSWEFYRKKEDYNFYFLFKISRFYKTCYNVNANYELLKDEQGGNDRLTPYTEGPIAHYLLSTEVPLLQLLFPKKVMYDIFKENTGFSYRYFTRTTGKSNLFSYLNLRYTQKRNDKKDTDAKAQVDSMLKELIIGLPYRFSDFEEIYDKFLTNAEAFGKADYLKLCRSLNMNYFLSKHGYNSDRS